MAGISSSQIVVIALPSRKQENLLALMDSLKHNIPVHWVNNCDQALALLSPDIHTLAFVDYREPTEKLQTDIEELFEAGNRVNLVLLRLSYFEKSEYKRENRVDLVYNDLTMEKIHQLLNMMGIK